MPKYSRKDKIILHQNENENQVVNITLLIDSNHPSPLFDQLLQQLNALSKSTLLHYKEPEDKKTKQASKKKNKFNNGVYV